MINRFFLLCIILIITLVGSSSAGAKTRLTFWTTEDQTERLEKQKQIAQLFALKTGNFVSVVPVSENRIVDKISEAESTHTLPDVFYHPVRFSKKFATSGLLDVNAATKIINRLGKKTFCAGSLNHVAYADGYAAVPIDGWRQLLLYRKDLFKEKGLSEPNSWDRILHAAQALHNAPLLWGIVVPNAPNQDYTQQVFEHFAISNGVGLLDGTGNVNLNTPAMVQTLKFYRTLNQHSPNGIIDWQHSRKAYVSGRAAMIMWSPFILDELSGLRNDLPVIPDIIKGDRGYLARNTGFVSSIYGPNGVAQYSQISGLGISKDADKHPSLRWIEFLLTDGYLKWLALAPEGKIPMRLGSRHEPNCFIKGWMELEFGVNTRSKISNFFGMDVLNTILKPPQEGLNHWSLTGQKEEMVSKIYTTKIIAKILKRFLDSELNAKEAARMMHQEVKKLE